MIANDSEVYRLDIASASVTPLTDRRGPDAAPVPSPDGRLIAYVGYDDHKKGFEQADLYVMNPDGSSPRKVAPGLDRSIDQLEWAADGRSIVAAYEEEGSVVVSRIGLDGRVSPIVRNVGGSSLDRPYAGGGFSVSRNGSIAFTTDSATRPADVSVSSGGKSRQLTRLNELSLSG
jgi:hypothetical protein